MCRRDDHSTISETKIVFGIMVVPILIFIAVFLLVIRPILPDNIHPMIEVGIISITCGVWVDIAKAIIEDKYGFQPFK